MKPLYYTPTFTRAMSSLVVNGFWARDLDADDHAFLEYVKVRGIANGSLPNMDSVSLEELEFWQLPYEIAPGVERRIGRPPRVIEPEAYREAKKARSEIWRARKLIRENEKAIAQAELDRERREWEAAQERRNLRNLIGDAEWEAAAPKTSRFGKTVDRHHVPQWKLDEMRRRHTPVRRADVLVARANAKARKLAAEAKERNAAEKAARELRQAAARAREEAIRLRAEAYEAERQHQAAVEAGHRQAALAAAAAQAEREWNANATERARQQARADEERLHREAVIQQNREHIERLKREEHERQDRARLEGQHNYQAYKKTVTASVKQSIMLLMASRRGLPTNTNDISRALNVPGDIVNDCLTELVNEGRLQETKPK